jgi:hypothetical protein
MSRNVFCKLGHSSVWPRIGRVTGLAVAMLPFVAGCGHPSGPPRVAVRGEVSLDDSPLKSGVIRFIPTGGTKGPVAVTAIKEGRYELTAPEGPVLGNNSIEIVPGIAADPLAGATDIRTAWAEYAKTAASRTGERAVPKKYKSISELKVQVQAKGKNTFDFKLASQ